MTHAPIHDFEWLPQDILRERTPVTKASMLASMPSGKGDITLINKNIRSAWALSLRPDNIGIPAYEDEQCAYHEILVIKGELSEDMVSSQVSRLQEMFHSSIPYPLFLWLTSGSEKFLSAVPLRHSRAEKSKELWDGPLSRTQCKESVPGFLTTLRPLFSHTENLRDLYFRWICALYGLKIYSLPWKKVLGQVLPFSLPGSPEEGIRVWESLSHLYEEWRFLDSQLKKERQPNHRVELGNKRFGVQEQIHSIVRSLSFRAFPE